ncbi:hypothetical protein DIS24_g3418 [Lasiodiplodia hormozganensis]|uniref:EF-hand domain-containing protein n=1 Tax=Lasiodiplodia hormozganensis TaxID=869390 RepID=A0AA40D4P8_9PEZI|nr:hypothetical protein DIS24_g3418 [Lasiodiplodia hormozganensis]
MQPSTLFVILSAIAPFAAAACCRADSNGICGDGTTGTPYCGYGPCDWTGCNCKGGCRSGSAAAMGSAVEAGASEVPSATDAFNAANVDGTGNLTLHQYTQYVGAADDDKAYVEWFDKHDTNGDGVLSLEEALAE